MRTRVIGMEKARARFAWLTLVPLGGMLFQGCGISIWMGGQGGGGGDGRIPPADGLILDAEDLELPDGIIRPDDFLNPDDRIDINGEL